MYPFSEDLLVDNLTVDSQGELLFAGIKTSQLAKQYATPLYLYDEQRIRHNCRVYTDAVKACFGEKGRVLFASKAACFKRMYEIVLEEGLYTDVVSVGEIVTAEKAGFDLNHAFFHSNNKTDEDIAFAIQKKIGYFVVDNPDELEAIEKQAKAKGVTQKILLRITPGIDPHTYEAITTGKVDSKFGCAIQTGQAEQITRRALECEHIALMGFHCHIGSQVFDSSVYLAASEVMLRFIAHIKDSMGYSARILDLGGGYGVRYTKHQPHIDIGDNIRQVANRIRLLCGQLKLDMPEIQFEPGRSICADAGITLYTVGSVKAIPGYKTYVSVDGSMADNPRFALYGAPYTVLPAGKMTEERPAYVSVVGRCCESGDIIQNDVPLPRSIHRGDLLAVLTTGAYHYSMASNYNMLCRPAVVMVNQGNAYPAVKRQTPEQLMENDC